MSNNLYDIIIVGGGMAGAVAAYKIAKENTNIRCLLIEASKQPAKRRQQTMGWLGCLIFSDGKFYQNDLDKISEIAGTRRTSAADKFFIDLINNIDTFNIIKDTKPNSIMKRKLKENKYDILFNDHYQMFPKEMHLLSRHMASTIENCKNITMSFDNEVLEITKKGKTFFVEAQLGNYESKKVIFCPGRSGWDFINYTYRDLDLIKENGRASFGIKLEIADSHIKGFNNSHCSIFKNDIEIGPLSWGGEVIPEDCFDFAIASFRSNENRWKSNNTSFNFIKHLEIENGYEQSDRIAKLTFIITNERIVKEKVSSIISKRSTISILPEYSWTVDAIKDFSNVIPEILSKGYYHAPTLLTSLPKIKINTNLEAEVDGLFIAGECLNVSGLLSAAASGIICATEVMK